MKRSRLLLAPPLVAACLVLSAVAAYGWHAVSISVKGQAVCTLDHFQVGHVTITNPENQPANVVSQSGNAVHAKDKIQPGAHDYTVNAAGGFVGSVNVQIVVNYPGDSTLRTSNLVTIVFKGGCQPPPTTTSTQPPPTTTSTPPPTVSLIPPTTATPPIAVTSEPQFTG